MRKSPSGVRGRPREGARPCCPHCKSNSVFVVKDGKEKNGRQRFNCCGCGRCFNEYTKTALAGLKTPAREVRRVLQALDEGIGVLGVERVFQHAEATVMRWLSRAGAAAESLQRSVYKLVHAGFVQFDELKTFVGRKKRELWFWKALDGVSKFWLAVHASFTRSKQECEEFLRKTKRVLAEAPLGASSDGLAQYTRSIPARWKTTPYAQVVKHYERRRLVSVEHKQVAKHTVADVEWQLALLHLGATLNTAFIERLNATNRAGPARFHRKTLHYSKNERAAIAAMNVRWYAYNYIRTQARRQNGVRQTPRTPAMKAGLAHQPLTWHDLLTQPT